MSRPKNVVVAQSGGPTPVINNSLRGVIETIKSFGDSFGRIYAGWHGVEGILKEELLDLSSQSDDEIGLLRTSPYSRNHRDLQVQAKRRKAGGL